MEKRIQIVYAGMYGSTAGVAEVIGQELSRLGAVVETQPASGAIGISSCDAVIVGSAIKYCKWLPDAVKFVQTHRAVLSRMPVAYFLTCVDLTRVPEEMGRDASIYLDPLLGHPPQAEGTLSIWEKMHLLPGFMNSVLRKAPQVKPVSIGVFRGKLDYSELRLTHWLLIKLGSLFTKRIPEGDFRNWEAIRAWTATLYQVLLQQGRPSLERRHKNMNTTNTNTNASQGNLPLDYFVFVFMLAVPFWLFGGGKLPLPINLPLGALVTFVPMTAAAILSYRQNGLTGLKGLFKKAWDYRNTRNRIWYLPALLLAPLIYVSSYAVMRLTGLPLPDPINIPLLMVPVLFVMFFITDTGEELGWSGYAIDPMQNRWGAVKASLVLGVVWAIWHTIPFVQTGNSATWVAWQGLKTVAMRMVIVWIYNKTGKSVFATTLFHTADNVSWSLFPNYASHYDPFVTGLTTWVAAGIVIIGWGSKTLARYRHAEQAKR